MLVVAPVNDLDISKRHVAHRCVKEAVRYLCLFIAGNGNTAVLVKLPGDAAGNAVQFHAVNLAIPHAVRQHPHKVADAAGRLQQVAAFQAHLCQRLVDGVDENGRGIKSGQAAGTGGGIFLLGEQRFQFGVPAVLFIEAVGKAAPAHIAGKGFLFFRRRQPVFLLDPLQGADGGHIGRILFRLAAHAKRPICDAEVMPLLGWYFRVERCKAHTFLHGLWCGESGFFFGWYFRPGYLHFCFCGRFRLHFWFLWRQFGRKIIRPTFARDNDRNTERFQLALHRFQRRDGESGHQIGAASAADSTFRCGISELVMQCLGILFKRLVEISNLYQYQRIRILCAQCGILLPNRACLCH